VSTDRDFGVRQRRRKDKTFMHSSKSGRRVAVLAMIATVLTASLLTGPAKADAAFQRWIGDFRGTAVANGVSAATYDRAFAGVTTSRSRGSGKGPVSAGIPG
jgi:membrane-bound lytic murein transglycosylase B